MKACPDAVEIGGRTDAIAYALKHLAPGDVLLVAGKGHETTQTIGDRVFHHHDGEVIQSLVRDITKERVTV